MFFHNFKYSFKTLLANKMLLFWTFIFPIVLGTLFNLAFSNIENSEKLNIIDIAIIDNEELSKNTVFKKSFETLSEDGENKLFNIKYTTLEEANDLLENNEITGYILLKDNKSTITVNSSGINETILKFTVDEINSNIEMINKLTSKEIENKYLNGDLDINYEEIYNKAIALINENNVQLNNISNSNLSYTMIEYYTLIAMSCLYGGILSMFITNYRLANMCGVGKRTSIAPVHKTNMILGSLLASYIIQLCGILLLFLYTIFVIKADYGNNLPLIVLISMIGSFAGLSLGIFVASLFKTHDNAKTGILIAIVMLCCYLSGMMGITIKYVIDKNLPIINILNPANMITDGLYSLYYYNTLDRYYFNVISLVIFSVLMIAISLRNLRRQAYDSI